MRFNTANTADSLNISSNSSVKGIKDISKTGMLLEHDGSLKVGDKFFVNLEGNDLSIKVEVQVVRLKDDSKLAGVKFINMDKATANKILFLNMKASR